MARKDSPASPLDILYKYTYICTVICTFLSMRKYLQYFGNLCLIQHDGFEKHHKTEKTTVNKLQNSTHAEIN